MQKTKTDDKILIVIPAYNEEKSITQVIQSIKKECPFYDIVVINDGSKDATALLAKECGVKVITIPYNLGIGGAVQTGLIYAERHGYDVAVQLDADGQHKSEEVNKLLKAIQEDSWDMVLGSRFLENVNYPSTFMRRLGNKIFSGLIAIITGQRFSDSTSGFRAFGANAISFLAQNRVSTMFVSS